MGLGRGSLRPKAHHDLQYVLYRDLVHCSRVVAICYICHRGQVRQRHSRIKERTGRERKWSSHDTRSRTSCSFLFFKYIVRKGGARGGWWGVEGAIGYRFSRGEFSLQGRSFFSAPASYVLLLLAAQFCVVFHVYVCAFVIFGDHASKGVPDLHNNRARRFSLILGIIPAYDAYIGLYY